MTDKKVEIKIEAQQRIFEYYENIEKDPHLQRLAGRVSSWYCTQDSNNVWHFGAARFVAYLYLSSKQYDEGDTSSTKSNLHLSQWAEKVESTTPLFKDLTRLLSTRLSKLGKSPRKNCKYYLIRN